jgi:hypothetical protein
MSEEKMRELDRATVQAKAEREVFQQHVSALAAQVIRDAAERGELPVSPDDVHWGEPPRLVQVTGNWYRVDSLDAAWAEAEAALPRDAVIRMGRSGGSQTRGWATAYLRGECIGVEFADTLPAALRALAAKLRERDG